MSNYDYRPNDLHGSRALDTATEGASSGVWIVVGLIAVLALIGMLVFGGASTDGTAPSVAPDGSSAGAPASDG
ncbi:MAG: hypothetical protein AAFR35_03435 [Pseudomonadota bacterium]